MVQQRINMTQHMLRKIRNEMSYMVADLYEEFQQDRRSHIENMVADVNEILRYFHEYSFAHFMTILSLLISYN